jgi:endo-1,4-beta-D-glucanase Y
MYLILICFCITISVEHKEQIEKVLEKERIQKEKEEKQKKEAEESKLKEQKGEDKVDEPVKSDDDKADILDNSPAGQVETTFASLKFSIVKTYKILKLQIYFIVYSIA